MTPENVNMPTEETGKFFPDMIANEAEDIREEIPATEEVATEDVATTDEPQITHEVEEPTNEEDPAAEEPKELIDDPENPLANIKQIEGLLKQAQSMVSIMEEQWMASARELHITDSNMKELDKWNQDHKVAMPENLPDEERAKWDHWNGIDCITEEEVERIFGPAPHPIYGVQHSQTIDRIKGACNDFFSWVAAMREYRGIHDAYLQLLELEEEKNIEVLRLRAEQELDPEKKKVMENSVELYYNRKFLEFLAEPLEDDARNRIINALTDQKKIEYWIKRTRDKLAQLKISAKIILEISQFEKRFLEEKYHKNTNLLLLYFLNVCTYCNAAVKEDDNRIKVVCMVIAFDAIIRKTWTEERMKRVLDNIRAFEDQFLPYISEPEVDETIAPPITGEDTPAETVKTEESEEATETVDAPQPMEFHPHTCD